MPRQPTGKKNGRPKRLSIYERDLAIMTVWMGLNLESDDLTQMDKRGAICNHFGIDESNLDAIITRCGKLLKDGKIAFNAEAKTFIFLEHKSANPAITPLREVSIPRYSDI
jgi:hypothetical protein